MSYTLCDCRSRCRLVDNMARALLRGCLFLVSPKEALCKGEKWWIDLLEFSFPLLASGMNSDVAVEWAKKRAKVMTRREENFFLVGQCWSGS